MESVCRNNQYCVPLTNRVAYKREDPIRSDLKTKLIINIYFETIENILNEVQLKTAFGTTYGTHSRIFQSNSTYSTFFNLLFHSQMT